MEQTDPKAHAHKDVFCALHKEGNNAYVHSTLQVLQQKGLIAQHQHVANQSTAIHPGHQDHDILDLETYFSVPSLLVYKPA